MSPARTRPDLVLLTLAMLVAIGYIGGTSFTTGYNGAIVQGDARGYFAYLPSLVLDRDITLNNQFETLHPEGTVSYPFGKGPQGRASNPFSIAPALLWLPGYLLGLMAEALLSSFRSSIYPAGYGAPAVWGAAAASILFAGLGAIVTRRLIAASIGERDALVAVVATWLGTAALYYTLVTPLYSHAVSWFGVAAMLYATHLAVTEPFAISRWLTAGVLAGYMVAIRLPDTSLLVMPLFMIAASAMAASADAGLNRREVASGLAAWSIGLGLGYLPQGIASSLLYGRLAPSSPTELGKVSHAGILIDALFSTGYEGWVSWTPLIALALVGLLVLRTRGRSVEARRLAYAAMLGVIAIYLTDVLHPYARPGAAFGGRRYVSASPLVAIGIAGVLDAVGETPLRRMVLGVMGVLVVWNLWLFLCYELLVNIFRVYPTLLQTARFAVGLGRP